MGVEVLTAAVVALALLPLLFTARDTGSRPVLALAIAGWLAAAVGAGVATYVYREDRPVPIATAIKNRPVEIARDVVRNTAPLSVALSKKLLWESLTLEREDVERKETALHHHVMGRGDAIEGAVSYLERRPPRFTSSVSNDWPDWPR